MFYNLPDLFIGAEGQAEKFEEVGIAGCELQVRILMLLYNKAHSIEASRRMDYTRHWLKL